MDYAQELKRLKQEIRDLKTSQLTQSDSKASVKTATIPINLPAGNNTWTIKYEDSNEEFEPLVDIPNASFFNVAILEYDEQTNTQTIQRFQREAETLSMTLTFYVISSRPIQSITRNF